VSRRAPHYEPAGPESHRGLDRRRR
jgi:hypothetical protein